MKKTIILFAGALVILASGCKKGYLDVNKNPNQSTTASPDLVLPAAQVTTAAKFDNPLSRNTAGGFDFIAGWLDYLSISGSYALSNSDFTTYKLTSDFGDAIFQGIYDNLSDYNYVENQAHATTRPFFEGIAKIMKAYNFAALVDLFNNVPYSEALQGTTLIHPKYDDASAIYGDLFKQITAGMTLIKSAPDADIPDSKSDLMFGKDKTTSKANWQAFGNSLKLRMLLHMSEMPTKPSYYASELAIVAASSAGFLSVDATVNPGYLNTAGKQNPFFGANFNVSGTYINDFYRANAYAVQFYKDYNDPRLSRVYSPVGANYVGGTIGSPNNPVGSASSTFGPGVVSSFSQDAVLMLASESYFEQAEAALRGMISGTPQTLYQQGIIESFRYLGVPSYTTAAATYYNQNRPQDTAVNYTMRTTTDQRIWIIIKQKWIAENMINVLEPYNDYRRFVTSNRNPKPLSELPLTASPSTDVRAVPYRLLYPTSEINNNTANVPQLSGTYPHHSNKIFWMP